MKEIRYFASVVMPTYNQPELLKQALSSFKKQSCQQFEVIIVDDGSAQPIRGYIDTYEYPFSITIIQHGHNRGRAAARNSGILRAQHEVIIFLDCDMTVEDNFIFAHLSFHQQYADDAIVLGNIQFAPDLSEKPLARYLDTRGVRKLKHQDKVPHRYFTTGNASVQKGTLQRTGLFDDKFPGYGGEDLELSCRLEKSGCRFFYNEQAKSFHHDLKPLNVYMERLISYGENGIPIILKKHPEAKTFLHTDWVENSTSFQGKLKYLAASRIFRPKPLSLLANLVSWVPVKQFQFFAFDIITGGSYLFGYQQYLKKNHSSQQDE